MASGKNKQRHGCVARRGGLLREIWEGTLGLLGTWLGRYYAQVKYIDQPVAAVWGPAK